MCSCSAVNGVNGSTALIVTAATATGTFSDGSTQNVTTQASWTSSAPAVATITAGGLATGVAAGGTTIQAAVNGVNGSTALTVTAATLQSVAVTPANGSIGKGATQQYTATDTFSDGSTQNVTAQASWTSSNTAIATISSGGLATGVAAGGTTIQAAVNGVNGSTGLTVTGLTLQSLAVTPANASILKGGTQQYTATGTFSDGSTQDLTAQASWTSSNTGVATITSGGLATGVAAGGTTIQASVNGVNGSTGLTVTNSVVSVWTHHNDNSRTGQNLNETILTPATVNSAKFGKLFTYSVDGYVYAQPLIMPSVNIAGQGLHDVVFVVTEHDSVYAFDADGTTSSPLWKVSFIDPATGVTTVPSSDVYDNGGIPDLTPEIGITSTPVIDTSTGTMFVLAVTKENGSWVHRLHALDITSGAERSNSPVRIQGTVPGTGYDSVSGQVTFNSRRQLQRPALLLLNGLVYVAFGSYGDIDPYHGWIFAYNENSLQQTYIYNVSPNGTEAAIWQSGTGPSVDTSGNIYVITCTGVGTAQGNSFLKLSSSLQLLDYMTPFNQASLSPTDLDLGSGGAVLLPDQSTGPTHLLVGAGKEGRVYLINRDNMGHFNSSGDNVVQELPGAVGPAHITSGNAAMYATAAFWNVP